MAISKRHRYKNRREKYARSRRNIRLVFLFMAIAAVVLLYKNRVAIYDRISIWFL